MVFSLKSKDVNKFEILVDLSRHEIRINATLKQDEPQKKHGISKNLGESVGEFLSFFAAILKNIVCQIK